MRISDWSSDVCSSDLPGDGGGRCRPYPARGLDRLRHFSPRHQWGWTVSKFGISPARKRVIVIGAAVILVVAIAAIWVKRAGNGDEALVLYGNVDIREVQLAFRQPGRVAEMAFQEGDVVTAGTRMALLDAQPYEDALAAAEAAVRVAQAEVDKLHGGLRPQEVAQTREALNRARAAATEAGRHYERQAGLMRSEEHTSELQSLMRISYAVFTLKK